MFLLTIHHYRDESTQTENICIVLHPELLPLKPKGKK